MAEDIENSSFEIRMINDRFDRGPSEQDFEDIKDQIKMRVHCDDFNNLEKQVEMYVHQAELDSLVQTTK